MNDKADARNGVAQVLAMETMSSTTTEDKLALSLVVPRKGIKSIRTAEGSIVIPDQRGR